MKYFNLYTLLLVAIVMTIFFGCTKKDLMTYQDNDGIYFLMTNIYGNHLDTIDFEFSVRPDVMQDSVTIPVSIMGRIQQVERSYLVKVDEAQTTAVAGRDYDFPADSAFKIKAGRMDDSLTIAIHRTQELYEKKFRIVLKLLGNDFFSVNMPVFDYKATGGVISASEFSITLSDVLKKPDWWDGLETYYGPYSRAKLTLLVSYLKLSYTTVYAQSSYSNTQLINFAKQLQQYLNEQQLSGNTIFEDNGIPMQLGPDAQQ